MQIIDTFGIAEQLYMPHRLSLAELVEANGEEIPTDDPFLKQFSVSYRDNFGRNERFEVLLNAADPYCYVLAAYRDPISSPSIILGSDSNTHRFFAQTMMGIPVKFEFHTNFGHTIGLYSFGTLDLRYYAVDSAVDGAEIFAPALVINQARVKLGSRDYLIPPGSLRSKALLNPQDIEDVVVGHGGLQVLPGEGDEGFHKILCPAEFGQFEFEIPKSLSYERALQIYDQIKEGTECLSLPGEIIKGPYMAMSLREFKNGPEGTF